MNEMSYKNKESKNLPLSREVTQRNQAADSCHFVLPG